MGLFDQLKPRGGLSNHEFNMKYDDDYAKDYRDRETAKLTSQRYSNNRDQYLGAEPVHNVPYADATGVGESTPGTGAFAEGVDPVQKFLMERNYGMMSSGDPALIKQALANQGSMQGNIMTGVNQKPDRPPNAYQEYQLAQQQGYKGSFMDFKQSMRPSTTNEFYEKQRNKLLTPGEADNYIMPDGAPLPAVVSWGQLEGLGVKRKNKISPEAAGKVAAIKSALNLFPNIRDNILTPDGEVDKKVLWEIAALNSPFGTAAGFVVSDRAKLANNALEIGMQAITRTETGAAMPETEILNTRIRYLPKASDSDVVINQKMEAYLYFLQNAEALLDPGRRDNEGLDPEQRWAKAVGMSFESVGLGSDYADILDGKHDAPVSGATSAYGVELPPGYTIK